MRAHASVYGRRSVGLAASGRANKDGQSKILSDNDLRFDPQWQAQIGRHLRSRRCAVRGFGNLKSMSRPPAKNP